MPTTVHFIGQSESCRLEQEFNDVMAAFHAGDSGTFTRVGGNRVIVYKAAVAYIEDAPEAEPMVASV